MPRLEPVDPPVLLWGVADADRYVRWLESDQHRVEALAGDVDHVAARVADAPCVLCLGLEGLPRPGAVVATLRRASPFGAIIGFTARAAPDLVEAVVDAGAFDCLAGPVERTVLTTCVRNASDWSRLSRRLVTLEQATIGMGSRDGAALPTLNLEQLERRAIEEALVVTRGRMTEVTRLLGIGRTTLYRKIRDYGLRSSSHG